MVRRMQLIYPKCVQCYVWVNSQLLKIVLAVIKRKKKLPLGEGGQDLKGTCGQTGELELFLCPSKVS
jgi:hypothetical protein